MKIVNYLLPALLTCGFAATASASVIGPFDKENGEAAEIAAALTQLSDAGADTSGWVALGKLEEGDIVSGLNIETEDYGLGLDATLTDLFYDGGELKGFDMALDAVAGYELTAVLIKAGTKHIIYYANMFDDMRTTLLDDKAVSHVSYFGTVSMSAVPLPGSLPLLAGGVILGGAVLRRRKG
ncbi:hypothetical protein E4Z66_04745 [Aliishimia ponticola]|uniref:VPLPA-CTERM sorting domain-containing protein n=1 Tax=Aliishimia ponticola TaxID=2499833 RepID=A0A4S4NKS0_9RHOB|nr:hypothetical protein [Aliishimia ponticola]THH38871.1 hypothetical protein E4Z66_04745 [Aliishimia ponticola]